MRRVLGALIALMLPLAPAAAQGLVQGGSGAVVPGHVGAWIYNGILGNGEGSAGCTSTGCNKITDFGITAPGTPLCIYDNPLDSAAGYHQLCLGAFSTISGNTGGFLSYNAYGGAAIDGIYVNINGTNYSFPGTGNGNVVGPPSPVGGNLPQWNGGTTLSDSGIAAANLVTRNASGVATASGLGNTSTAATLSSFNPLYFTTYTDQKATSINVTSLTGTVSDSNGSFRDSFYSSIQNSDTSVYTNPHSNYGGRFASFGPYANGDYVASYQNHVGLSAYALGNTVSTHLSTGVAPGIEGISGEAFQYGAGIGDNEFAAHNPSAANGGTAQSVSIAAIQAIVDYSYADADGSHTAYAVLASNTGSHTATAAFGASGGEYISMLDGQTIVAKQQGIIMPGTAADATANYAGTIINYGLANGNPSGGSYTYWAHDVNGGEYIWVDSGAFVGKLDATTGLTLFNTTLLNTGVSLADGAGAQTATMTNAPVAGNPTKWIAINDNGTVRHIPAW